MVISGPDSRDISTKAPASSLVPYCCITEAYSPPLVMSIDATSARTDSPAKKPNSTPFSGMKRYATAATIHATAILVTTSVPDLRSTVPVALSLIEAPMQKNHTARIGTVPEISPLVKQPKYFPASGAKVWQIAPRNNGTNIIPPGIFSIARLICMWFPPDDDVHS